MGSLHGPLMSSAQTHEVAARLGGAGREVDEVATLVLDDVRRPDRTDIGGDGVAQRLPVDQIARVPDRQTRVGIERGQGEVVIVTVLEHRRVRVIAGQDRVEVAAIAQVGHALVLDAALGEDRCIGRPDRSGRQQACGGQRGQGTGHVHHHLHSEGDRRRRRRGIHGVGRPGPPTPVSINYAAGWATTTTCPGRRSPPAARPGRPARTARSSSCSRPR